MRKLRWQFITLLALLSLTIPAWAQAQARIDVATQGGIETHVRHLAEELDRLGVNVAVASRNTDSKK